MGVPEERDDHAVHPVDTYEPRDLGDAAEDGHILDLGSQLPRAVVDEADNADPVLGVLDEFSRDQLANVAGADNEGCLCA